MRSPPMPTSSEGEVTLGVADGFSVHTVFSIQRLFSKFFSKPVNGEGCSPYFSEARQCGRSKNLGTFQLMPDNQA